MAYIHACKCREAKRRVFALRGIERRRKVSSGKRNFTRARNISSSADGVGRKAVYACLAQRICLSLAVRKVLSLQ